MIDTLTPVYNKFTIYNSCVNFLKNGTNREKRPYHTHTPSLSCIILSHTLLYGILFIIAFSKFTLLQAGCYFFCAHTTTTTTTHRNFLIVPL